MSEFIVSVYHEVREDSWVEVKYKGTDPKEAITEWVKWERKFPTMVSIDVRRLYEACELIDYAYKNMDWLKELCDTSGFPYKWDYIENGVGCKYQTGCDTFHELEIDGIYCPDQVYPFCLG